MSRHTIISPPGGDGIADLEARGAVFAVLARLLGPDPAPLLDEELNRRLRDVLAGLDERLDTALDGLGTRDVDDEADVDELGRRWIRWFEHARIPPYEASNVAPTAGGITPRLADIAGFYRAFGVRVTGERSDHVVAQLEFMSVLLTREAAAGRRGDDDAATVCHDAIRAFLRDHLGTWIEAWAARVADEPALRPWAGAATVAALLVALEARQRNVVPLRTPAVLDHHLEPAALNDDHAPSCASTDH